MHGDLAKRTCQKKWITYSRQPFGGPEQVLKYPGRYTHRVAITNNLTFSIDDGEVTFNYRDRGDENKVKKITIKVQEFIRRHIPHILPKGFVKIRYFNFLAHTNKKASVPLFRQLTNPDAEIVEKQTETLEETVLRLTGDDISLCPDCAKGKMISIELLPNPLLNTSSRLFGGIM